MNFPPIFAYVIFGFIWLLQLTLDLTGVGAVVAEIVAFIGEVFLFLWLFSRYGFDVFKKFSDAKNGKKFKKRFLIQLFGDLIPFVNMIPWNLIFIYQQYKQDLKEENGEVDQDTQEKKSGGLLKTAATVAAVALAPETGGASLAAEGALMGEAAAAAEGFVTKSVGAEASSTKTINPWINRTIDKDIKNKRQEKTITEEVSGIKTGQNFEDYNAGLKDYSDIATYEQDLKEKEEQKQKENIENQKEKDLKRMQGIKEQQNLREKMIEESNRRFGKDSNEIERLRDVVKDKYRENIDNNEIV